MVYWSVNKKKDTNVEYICARNNNLFRISLHGLARKDLAAWYDKQY